MVLVLVAAGFLAEARSFAREVRAWKASGARSQPLLSLPVSSRDLESYPGASEP